MKKRLILLATAAVAGAIMLTASGCGSQSRNLASLSSNWYSDPAFKNIQPTFTDENAEKLTYKVVQSQQSLNADYSAEFAEGGTYTTLFHSKKITATELADITLEKWRDGYSALLGKEGYMFLYYYKTELKIPSVTFKVGENSKTFNDQSVVSESYFLSVADYLAPVYTKRTVHRTLPAEMRASSVDNCCYNVDMDYASYYEFGGNSVTSYITDLSKQPAEPREYSVGGLNSGNNSSFDYTYLDIIVRAMHGLSSSSSLTLSLYTPGLQPRDYTIAAGTDGLLSDGDKAAEQLASVQAVLEEKGLFTPQPVKNEDGTETLSKLETRSASVSYNGGSFSGVSQKYWFAVGGQTRTVMVKYTEPLAYGLGALDYILTEIG